MSNRHNLQAAIDEENRRKDRALMSDTYNLDCSRMPPSEPYKDESLLGTDALNAYRARHNLPPLPTYPVPADSGQRLRRSDTPAEKVSDPVNKGIDATLAERGARYGDYMEKAFIIQDIKGILRGASSWEKMDPDMRESLEMVIHKIGRIVTGDPEYLDSWTDIMGYTKLVADRLETKAAA